MSPALVQAEICVDTKQLKKNIDECDSIAEWFTPNSDKLKRKEEPTPARPIRMRRPVGGLHLAYDPRIPDHSQAFEFYIEGLLDHDHVEWVINGNPVLIKGGRYDWPVSRGQYEVHARVVRDDETVKTFKPVKFRVK